MLFNIVDISLCFFVGENRIHRPALAVEDEDHFVRLRRDYPALLIHRAVLAEELRQRHHPLYRPSADSIALEAERARGVIQPRIQEDALRVVLPASSEAHDGALALYRAALEDETLVVLPGTRGGYRVRPFATLAAFLAVQQAVPEIDIAVATDKIHRAVDLAGIEIMRSSFVIGEIRILVP